MKGTIKRWIPFFPLARTLARLQELTHIISPLHGDNSTGDMTTYDPLDCSVDMYGHLLIDGHCLSPSFAFSSFILCKLKDPLQRLLLPCFLQWCIHHMHQFVSNCMWDVLGAKGYINPQRQPLGSQTPTQAILKLLSSTQMPPWAHTLSLLQPGLLSLPCILRLT